MRVLPSTFDSEYRIGKIGATGGPVDDAPSAQVLSLPGGNLRDLLIRLINFLAGN